MAVPAWFNKVSSARKSASNSDWSMASASYSALRSRVTACGTDAATCVFSPVPCSSAAAHSWAREDAVINRIMICLLAVLGHTSSVPYRCGLLRIPITTAGRSDRRAVFLQFAIQRGFPDAETARGLQFVSLQQFNGVQDGLLLNLVKRGDCLRVGAHGVRFRERLEVPQPRRQVSDVDGGKRTGRAGALHAVLEFAHIARPVVGEHHPQGVISQRVQGLGGGVDPLQHVANEQRNVLFALTQGRDAQGKHVEAEVEVAAE